MKDRQIIKSRLPEYLEGKGINISKNFNCLNPSHPDKNPSMSYYKEAQKVKCFSCGESYDVLDLIGLDYGLTNFKEQIEKAKEIFLLTGNLEKAIEPKGEKIAEEGEEKADYRDFYEEASKNLSQTDYYKKRGLSEETAKHFNLGYVKEWKHPKTKAQAKTSSSPMLIIPISASSYTARCTIDSKMRYWDVGKKGLFNIEALKGSEPVFIVEGELDAMSIHEVGGSALGLASTAMARQFIEAVKKTKPQAPLLIALDNDRTGKEATEKIKAELEELDQDFLVVNLYGKYKDANETLLKDRPLLTANVDKWRKYKGKKAEEYLKNSAKNVLEDFLDVVTSSGDTPRIPTGFNRLDELLDGGLYEGLYIMGAVSSLGKTTLALQIADQIAMQGKDVLIFSLEMSRHELIAKSISRRTLLAAWAPENRGKYNRIQDPKTARGITESKRYFSYRPAEHQLINEAIDDYRNYAENVFILEGIGDIGVTQIRERIEEHIKMRGKKPVVFIDYLQILAPYNDRASDKQNTDKAVLELKRISRDLKLPVIGISSFNRQNYNAKVSMAAFKESGAVEYSSDVLMGLQVTGTEEAASEEIQGIIETEKKKDDREIELVILKNRHGRANVKARFDYYAKFNYFEESKEQPK